ncbi:hypothetical protein AA0116_g13332 [Alternaria tenuissima]|nr:hypothetical protein AA0116_g13332 [Alternaria tenuissima]
MVGLDLFILAGLWIVAWESLRRYYKKENTRDLILRARDAKEQGKLVVVDFEYNFERNLHNSILQAGIMLVGPGKIPYDMHSWKHFSIDNLDEKLVSPQQSGSVAFLPVGIELEMAQEKLSGHEMLAICVGTGTVTFPGTYEFEPVALSEAIDILHKVLAFG